MEDSSAHDKIKGHEEKEENQEQDHGSYLDLEEFDSSPDPETDHASDDASDDAGSKKKASEEIYFPHDNFRNIQDDLIEKVASNIEKKKNFIVHAPTGLGKTAATIAPALTYALKNKKTIFFLTSRHTQHQIAVETLNDIKQKYDLNFSFIDIIGKKWMCPQPGTDSLYSGEFSEYCKAVREDGKCPFYVNTKNKSNKLTIKAEAAMENIRHMGLNELIRYCANETLCPYEMSLALGKNAVAVICDYYYVFNPDIREMFFGKINKSLDDIILIVDEAHNLPFRVRDLMTERLSNIMVKRALKEARKYGYDDIAENLLAIENALRDISKIEETINRKKSFGQKDKDESPQNSLSSFTSKQKKDEGVRFKPYEKLVKKDDFKNHLIKQTSDYEQLIADLEYVADEIREKQKVSYIGSISSFLEQWEGDDFGFARIMQVKPGTKGPVVILSYRCLDPSLICKDVVNNTHSTIIMSGTLVPVQMYKDLIGVEYTDAKVFESPFPDKNRLNLVIPDTSTKYSMRSDYQFEQIAKACADITNLVPGNSAIFFPSYSLRDKINYRFTSLSKKTTFLESPGMTKNEKAEVLKKFKSYQKQGAVLLGVSSGSFGEGIDLPGDLLKCVIVVGLPLQQPDLETKELINYFDKKFGKGWDYGYIFPAFNKTLQNAGRCIRSETDKGIVVFLDERYAWPRYMNIFPKELKVKVTRKYMDQIKDFFYEDGIDIHL